MTSAIGRNDIHVTGDQRHRQRPPQISDCDASGLWSTAIREMDQYQVAVTDFVQVKCVRRAFSGFGATV